jgi:hypothetical protein
LIYEKKIVNKKKSNSIKKKTLHQTRKTGKPGKVLGSNFSRGKII